MAEYRRVRHNVQQNIRRLGQRDYDISGVSIPSFISKNATPSQIRKETKRLQKISDTRYKKTTKTVTVTKVNKRTGKVTEERKTVTGTKAREYDRKESARKAHATQEFNREQERRAVLGDEYSDREKREAIEDIVSQPIGQINVEPEPKKYRKPREIDRTGNTMVFDHTAQHLMNIAKQNVLAYKQHQGSIRKKRKDELTSRAKTVSKNADDILAFLNTLPQNTKKYGETANMMMSAENVKSVEWFYEENGATNFINDFYKWLYEAGFIESYDGEEDESDEGESYDDEY